MPHWFAFVTRFKSHKLLNLSNGPQNRHQDSLNELTRWKHISQINCHLIVHLKKLETFFEMLSVIFITQQVWLNNVHRLICNHYTISQSDHLIVLLIGAENLNPNGQLHRGRVGGRLIHNLLFCSAKYGLNQSYWRWNICICRPF